MEQIYKITNVFLCVMYSGLDIVAIKQCVTLLVDLAKQGRTVVCTIHQPSSSLFHMFDHVYMLARGSCIYNGSPRQLVPFLAQIGHVCKPTHNPADFGKFVVFQIIKIKLIRPMSFGLYVTGENCRET